MRMHSARRRLLRGNAAFEKRSWDPVSDYAYYSSFESGFALALPVWQARAYCLFVLFP
jgi:hypothetical protein